jgi:hypothetical protein
MPGFPVMMSLHIRLPKGSSMRLLPVIAATLALCLSATADARRGKRAEKDDDGETEKKVSGLPLRFRFGLSLDGARDIELGADRRTTVADEAVLGGNLGVSYVGVKKLSLDVDLELAMNLNPDGPQKQYFDRLELTPGARYDLIEGLYLRAGAPLIIYPGPFNAGVLGGVGYHQSLGDHVGAYAEVAYERYLIETDSRVVVRGGIEAGN